MRAMTVSLIVQFVCVALAFGALGDWSFPGAVVSVGLAAAATALNARWGQTSARRWSAIGLGMWLILAFSAWHDIVTGVAAPSLVIQAQRAALWAWFFGGTTGTLVGARDARKPAVIAAILLGVLVSLIAGRVLRFSGYVADLDPWTSRALLLAPAAFVAIPMGAAALIARYGMGRSAVSESGEA